MLSCRALGLGIEETFLAALARQFVAEGTTVMLGKLTPTDANLACRQVFSRNGFALIEGAGVIWSRPLTDAVALPGHVLLTDSN